MNALIERHPVSTYVALTFAISWGGVLIVVGPGGSAGIAGLSLLLSDLTWFAAVWAVVAVIAVTNGRTPSRQPLERQAA